MNKGRKKESKKERKKEYQSGSLVFAEVLIWFFRQRLEFMSSIGPQILKEEIKGFNSGVSVPLIG